MANTITLGLDGATIILKIGTKTYPLTAPYQELSFGTNPGATQHVHFRFKEDAENAVNFGTIDYLLNEVQTLIFSAQQLPGAQSLLAQWQGTPAANGVAAVVGVIESLKTAPILGSAVQTVINTEVKIVEIEFDVTKTTHYPNGSTTPADSDFEGTMRLGVVFTPQAGNRPRFFNVEVMAFGGVLVVKFKGTVNGAFPW